MEENSDLRKYYSVNLVVKILLISSILGIILFIIPLPEEIIVAILMIFASYLYKIVRNKAVIGEYPRPYSRPTNQPNNGNVTKSEDQIDGI